MGVYGGPGTEVWATGIEEDSKDFLPISIVLQISPNPFRHKTVIRFEVLDASDCQLKIHDAAGRLVKSFNFVYGIMHRESSISWDGTDNFNRKLPSGVYFLKFKAGDYSATEKLLLIR